MKKAALRLARAPLFTTIAVISLALGIGANAGVFSLVNTVLLQQLPVPDPEQIVVLYQNGPQQGNITSEEQGDAFSYPVFKEIQNSVAPIASLVGISRASVAVGYRDEILPAQVRLVSDNYFDVLGVRPALGRLIEGKDDAVAVLDYRYWLTRFGGNPRVLNQALKINSSAVIVVGVAPKTFEGERPGSIPNVYMPLRSKAAITPGWNAFADRMDAWVMLLARLAPGISREQAASKIGAVYRAQLEADIPFLRRPDARLLAEYRAKNIVLKDGSHGRGQWRNQSRRPLLLLLALTGLVLVIACANVANLQLARSVSRRGELAVRMALGASRRQVIREPLAESCLLAFVGGTAALPVAHWTATLLEGAPVWGATARVDVPVFVFCFSVAVVSGVLFGIYPAVAASRPDLAELIQGHSTQVSSSTGATIFRRLLVGGQVSMSLLLLLTAGLFGKTLLNLMRTELGIRSDNIVTFSVPYGLYQYTDQQAILAHEQIRERIASLPGLYSVSSADTPVIAGSRSGTSIQVDGFPNENEFGVKSYMSVVGADYFRTLGTPLVMGREFGDRDNAGAPKVAIVNEAFVKKFFQGHDPLGRELRRGGVEPLKVVGVVKDSKYASLKEPSPPLFYTPLGQKTRRLSGVYFYLRTSVDPQTSMAVLRREVAAVDRSLPVLGLKTLEAQIEETTASERKLAALSGAFAALATVLAAIGLYGTLAYNVVRRTREIGIRMALGAETRDVRRLILFEVMVLLVGGTIVGLLAAGATGRVMQGFLYEMKWWDPAVGLAAVVVLWIVGLWAAWVPTREATAVDPMIALRWE